MHTILFYPKVYIFDITMTVMCDVILTSSSKFQNKIKEKENKNKKEIKND